MLPFSEWFAKINPKTNLPINGGLVMLGISILMILTGQFNQLTDLIVFVIWFFITLTFIAVMILRKTQPDIERPYKVPLYPVIPLIAIIGGLYIILNTLIVQPENAFIGILLTLIGIPVYFYCKKKYGFTEKD